MRKTILVNLFVAALTVGTLTGCEMGADKNAPKFKEISIEYNRSNSSGLGQISYGNTSESEQFEKDIEEMVPPIKEECNTKYFLSPNEQYTVKVTFENPKEYPISSITYGGQVFVASSFVNEVSTDEVKFVATAPNMPGYKDLSISNFTYLKKEKINEVQLTDAEASINLGVKYVSGVTAELIDKIPSSSRATINLSFNDSDYISDYELTKFYLSDGSKIVYEKKLEKGRNSIECVSLLNEHRYQFGVYTVFDRIDGSGRHSEWSLKDTFTTKNAFLIENVNADRTAIEFEVKSVGVDETIETIDLIDTATNEVVKTIQGDKRKFEEILSNHEYNLVINYKYKVGNEDVVGKTEYKGIKTRKSIEPTGSLELSSNYEDVTYNASFVDEDKIIKSYKADLIKNNEIIASFENEPSKTFENLLSDNEYKVTLTIIYDLNEGNGTNSKEVEKSISTKAKDIPYVKNANLSSDYTSISYNLELVDNFNCMTINKVVLVKDNEVIKENNGNLTGTFEGLLSDNEYRVKVLFGYDLNNGRGVIDESFESSIKTLAKDKPSISKLQLTPDYESISYSYEYLDTFNIINLNKVVLVKDGQVVKENGVDFTGTFEGLLSNNEYQVKVLFSYDLNDGRGLLQDEYIGKVTTLAKEKPTVKDLSIAIGQESINYIFDFVDTFKILGTVKVRLYKNDELIKENNGDRQGLFDNLLSNNEYRLDIVYTYDLNDGTGTKEEIVNETVTTAAKLEPILDSFSYKYFEGKTDLKFDDNGYVCGVQENHSDVLYIDAPIARHAFYEISGVKTIYIGPNCTVIGEQAFYKTWDLDHLIIDSNAMPNLINDTFGFIWGTDHFRVYVKDEIYDTAINQHFDDGAWETFKYETLAKYSNLKEELLPTNGTSSIEATKDSITFALDYYDVDNCIVNFETSLYLKDELINKINSASGTFENALSNTNYVIKVVLTYDLNDGLGNRIITKDINTKTLAKETPLLDLTEFNYLNDRDKFNYNDKGEIISVKENCGDVLYVDAPVAERGFDTVDSVVTVYLGPNCTSIGTAGFYNCLNLRNVIVDRDSMPTPVYDIFCITWDADGFAVYVRDEIFDTEMTVVTPDTMWNGNRGRLLRKYSHLNEELIPSRKSGFASSQDSVSFDIKVIDVDNTATGITVELYLGNELVQTSNEYKGTFNNLLSNSTYRIAVKFNYDLNDGRGVSAFEGAASIKTKAKVAPEVDFKRESSALNGTQTLKYVLKSDGTYSMEGIGTCDDSSTLILGGYYNGQPITELRAQAFLDEAGTQIDTAIILDTVTKIGYELFYGTEIKTIIFQGKTAPLLEYNFLGHNGPNIYIPKESLNSYLEQFRDCSNYGVYENGKVHYISELGVREDEYFNGNYDLKIGYDYIAATYVITDIDSTLVSADAELYLNGELVQKVENAGLSIRFENLYANNNYVLKYVLKYNLNDGNGICTFEYVLDDARTLAYRSPVVDQTSYFYSNCINGLNFDAEGKVTGRKDNYWDNVVYIDAPIAESAFEENNTITVLYLGPNCTYLDTHAFLNAKYLKTVIIDRDELPTMTHNTFGYTWNDEDFKVYVKDEIYQKSIETWMPDEFWNEYKDRFLAKFSDMPNMYKIPSYVNLESITQLVINYNDVSYDIAYSDPDNVIKSIKTQIFNDGQLIKENVGSVGVFDDLLCGYFYEVKFIVGCDYKDGRGVVTKEYVFKAFQTKTRLDPATTGYGYSYNSNYIDVDVGFVNPNDAEMNTEINLYLDDVLIETAKDVSSYRFENLYSNTQYHIQVEIYYDLRDGQGWRGRVVNAFYVSTSIAGGPAVYFDRGIQVDKNSVSYKIAVVSNGAEPTINAVRLYDENANLLKQNNGDLEGSFSGLDDHTAYIIGINYFYDLNDRTGPIEANEFMYFVTTPYDYADIGFESLTSSLNRIDGTIWKNDEGNNITIKSYELYNGEEKISFNNEGISFNELEPNTTYRVVVRYILEHSNNFKTAGEYTIERDIRTKAYTVVYKDELGNQIYQTIIDAYETPVFVGDLPTKASDEEFSYQFDKWVQGGIINNRITFTPQFVKCTKGLKITENKVIRYSGSIANVVIPSKWNGYVIDTIADEAFRDCTNVESVVLPETVQYLSSWAFAGCTSLTSINIPDGVENISEGLFNGCTSLTNIAFPESVRYIYYASFSGANLSAVTLPEGLVCLGSWCFQNNNFDTIHIPYSVKEIYDNVFNKSGTVTVYFEISGPRSSFYEGWDASVNAVWDNSGYIKDAEVNGYRFALYDNGVRTYAKLIGMDESLPVFNMPLMVEDIYVAEWDEQVVKNATNNFTTIIVPEGTKAIVDQEIFKYYKETLLEVSFPSTLKYVTDHICSGCTKLERVTFAEGIKVIGQGAFYGTALTRIELPASIIYLRSMCFHRGENITEYVFNNPDLKFEDGEIFWHGAKAELMKLPEHLEVIGDRNLLWAQTKYLIIPETVTRIEHANISYRWIDYVLFAGTSSQWSQIEIINYDNDDDNINSNIYFYSESAPEYEGKYWHYDQYGNPVIWEKITVRLLNGNGSTEYTANIYPGQPIYYYSSYVDKAPTNEYSYMFIGWDRSLTDITESCTINAVFKPIHHLATVTFKNGSTTLQTSLVNVGGAVTYTGETPYKAPVDGKQYEFIGWSTNKSNYYADFDLSRVNDSVVLFAIFELVPIRHQVTFKDYDGTILYEYNAIEGSQAVYGGSKPTREKVGDMYYVFRGWDKSLDNILEDTVFTAVYLETDEVYTVTFKNYDDSVLYETIVLQGDKAVYEGETPIKVDGGGVPYTFVGWSKSLEDVQDNMVLYAQFLANLDGLATDHVYVMVDEVTGLTEYAWNAQLDSKECLNFSGVGKLTGNDQGYVLYTITSEKEMDVRIWAKYSYTNANKYDRETGSGQQTLWYDFENGLVGWKYILTVNGQEIDQSLQSYDLGTEVVNMQYLTYYDFGDTYPIETPWVQIHLNQGENTIKIMRHVGYGLSFTYFRLIEIA